jgi:hypothetical protein
MTMLEFDQVGTVAYIGQKKTTISAIVLMTISINKRQNQIINTNHITSTKMIQFLKSHFGSKSLLGLFFLLKA